jgi:hypothetical protein
LREFNGEGATTFRPFFLLRKHELRGMQLRTLDACGGCIIIALFGIARRRASTGGRLGDMAQRGQEHGEGEWMKAQLSWKLYSERNVKMSVSILYSILPKPSDLDVPPCTPESRRGNRVYLDSEWTLGRFCERTFLAHVQLKSRTCSCLLRSPNLS